MARAVGELRNGMASPQTIYPLRKTYKNSVYMLNNQYEIIKYDLSNLGRYGYSTYGSGVYTSGFVSGFFRLNHSMLLSSSDESGDVLAGGGYTPQIKDYKVLNDNNTFQTALTSNSKFLNLNGWSFD